MDVIVVGLLNISSIIIISFSFWFSDLGQTQAANYIGDIMLSICQLYVFPLFSAITLM